jgi:Na+-translocating ferredoxin:NAD+ oxidoreductase subunit B
MTGDIYTTLREKIDKYSVGFASTESGVEFKILKKLFTEEEAGMYLNLTEALQTGKEIAEKINQDPAEVEALLQRMTEKGHTLPRFPQKKGEPFYYAAAPYIHGILEHQLHRADPELAELFAEHFAQGPVSRLEPQLRTIPVKSSINDKTHVATYDDAEAVIRKKERIALADCVCNDLEKIRGGACDQPSEVCFLFGFYAEYYVNKGMGRWVTQKEALQKLKECDEAGLVPNFSDSESPEALCNCCPNCCGYLRTLKQLPEPALAAPSNHYAKVSSDLCSACEICIDRCPMDAISMSQYEIAAIEIKRCIGCGLCVSTCPEDALRLILKPEDQRYVPPEKGVFMRSSKELEAILSKGDPDY